VDISCGKGAAPDGYRANVQRPKQKQDGGRASSTSVVEVGVYENGSERGGFEEVRFSDRN